MTSMLKRSRKPQEDENQIAFRVETLLGKNSIQGKNPAAVALGRLGGKKGGRARADKLDANRRSEIARLGAVARWAAKPRDQR